MGGIFDRELGEAYDRWYRTAYDRSMDACVSRLVTTLIKPLHNERILDIGCGSGNHLLTFREMGLDGTGVDPSAEMISEASKRLGPGCDLRRADAADLPFEDNEFDLVSLINTLEFVENPLGVLREAGRVAARKVFIITVNNLSCFGASSKIRGFFGDRLFGSARQFNIVSLKNLVARAYGDAPIQWRSLCGQSRILGPLSNPDQRPLSISNSPFGQFIAVSVKMKYVVITDNISIKDKLKKARLSLVRPGTVEPAKQSRRD